MSSIIEGYNYDIFISYRQKDNKHDGWVTEFVENLKGELDSMFKDEVSVYFDINPSDYLLESYDVDASLKDKLKCLIFIPIISRTYCDPKSFAWDNELKAFIDKASKDQFGFKIKLSNSNVANRVLPIRIHDLDISDVKLFESVVGGLMRSIDFVYKETGVNRQLRAKDDDIIKSPGQILYRDQINKVALTVKEIIESIKATKVEGHTKIKEVHVKEFKDKEEINVREPIREELINHENRDGAVTLKQKHGLKSLVIKKPWIWMAGIAITIILVIVILFINHNSKVRWARQVGLPALQQYINEFNMASAFKLAQKAEKYISKDPKFAELANIARAKLTFITDPPGADVYIREYSKGQGEWTYLGKTPIDSLRVPSFNFYLTRIEKPEYENVLAVGAVDFGNVHWVDTLYRKLFKKGSIPEGMVYIEGFKGEEAGNFLKARNGFFMDRFEVTNKQYKEFVDAGGYRNKQYWKNEFIKEGKALTWENAMSEFVDRSERSGPATWEAGEYPNGQENYPVTGISWYEAAAYSEFMGKSLPTLDHWYSGTGIYMDCFQYYFNSRILSLSNFYGIGVEAAGKFHGIGCYGTYDMAGNAREWCWNETPVGHTVCGGGWDDAEYMYLEWSHLPSFDRSSKNGFRCVQYIDKEKIAKASFNKIKYEAIRDFSRAIPVPENVFKIYKNQFLYDKKELFANMDRKDSTNKDYIIERISFNAAYGNERVIAYLYLPRKVNPPFQTIMFFPAINALYEKDVINSFMTKWDLDFIIKSGRAVFFPVYKGTFERQEGGRQNFSTDSHENSEWIIKMVKDFSRAIDYLETRTDIDSSRLGYLGHSWGGEMGGIIPGVEDRLALCILNVGGFPVHSNYLPEVDAVNYVPRIKIPVLMLNGRYDNNFPLETSVKPFFNLLGTSKENKSLIVYETDHYVPKSEMIKEILNWLDKYFGPVNYLKDK